MPTAQSAERALVELTASGAQLREILESAVLLVEQHAPGMLCSILLLDAAEGTLHTGAAPHLPAEYMASLEGVQIGPNVGSCGAAAFAGRSIEIEDDHFVARAPARPANWVSWDDGIAFAAWARLRPMTEFEYTKACRGPSEPVAGDYPWGTSSTARLRRLIVSPNDSSE